MNILLDYVFKITAINPTPAASTAFLKQACVVAKPKSGMEGSVGTITLCTSKAAVAALTDNDEADELFDAGMSRVYILLANDLELDAFLVGHESDFYTLLISSDFTDADVISTQAQGTVTVTSYANLVSGTDDGLTIEGVTFTAQAGASTLGQTTFTAATSNDATAASLVAQINGHPATAALVVASAVGAVVTVKAKTAGYDGNDIDMSYTDNDTNVGITLAGLSGGKLAGGTGIEAGEFEGVIGVSSDDVDFLEDQAVIENRCAFAVDDANGAKNMFFAFGSLLANSLRWLNQQYITMPYADDTEDLGTAENLFDKRISFVLNDDQYGKRLAMFACGGKAIAAPYILKNLMIDLQSEALTYISGNQPDYTKTEAALMEDELQDIINVRYIDKKQIEDGVVEIKLEQDDFVASGYINVKPPRALWKLVGELRQTL